MCIPVAGLEEVHEERRPPEFRVESEAFEKAVKGMSPSLGEVWAEAITADVLHLVLVGQRGNGALWILEGELFVEEDKVGEAAADFGGGFGKRFEVRLIGRILAITAFLSGYMVHGNHAEPRRTFVVTR